MADIFISYARGDRERIADLSAALEQHGWSIWWDRHIDGGSAFAQAIEAELQASGAVVVAWSRAALQSDWVKDEAAAARDQGKLVPVSLDGSVPPLGFRQYHVIDLSGWNGEPSAPALSDLRRSLGAKLGGAAAASDATAPAQQAARATPTAPTTARKWVLVVVALLGLGAAGAFLLRGERAGDAGGPAAETPADGAAAGDAKDTIRDKSIAVLPFANRSAKPDDAYFAEGMHDDLLTQLSRVGDLRVVSRTSVARYEGTDKPITQVASELGVGVVLEGAVQRAGDRVRINVQLIDGRTDTQLWAETFDRELTVANLFEIQSEITTAIAAALESVLAQPGRKHSVQLPTQSIEAYNAFLLGNTLNRFDDYDETKMERAAAAYGEAVSIDPRFAEAHARKALAHLTLAWWQYDTEKNIRLAEQSLERARALAPDLGDTQVSEGYYLYWIKGDYAGAEAATRAAIEQSPRNADLWELRGSILRRSGDTAGARAAFERAREIDPKSASVAVNLAFTDAYMGRLAEARRLLDRAKELRPDTSNVAVEAVLYALEGDVEATWAHYQDMVARGDYDAGGPFADLAFSLRDPERLALIAQRLEGQEHGSLVGIGTGYFRAVALQRLGRTDEAHTLARQLKARLVRELPHETDRNARSRLTLVALEALLGEDAEARAIAAEVLKSPPRDQLWLAETAPILITAYADLGDPDAAFDLVEQAMDRFSPVHFVNVRNDVGFDPYRDLPRYKALNARYEAWKAKQPAR